MKRRRKFTSQFKSKVALEALREQQPIHEIAKRYQVHPSQVTEWKKTLLGQASTVFDRGKAQTAKETKDKRLQEKLYKNIGQLKVEVDFLKDSCEKLGVPLPQEYHD
jgi:transposase